MSVFVDIHTHKPPVEGYIAIQSRGIETIKVSDKPKAPFSTGIHPWVINQINVKEQLRVLAYTARNPMVCAIGECGIDRAVAINPDRQIEIFEEHIRIANFSEKPMIIHSVKAYADFLHLIKKHAGHTPWIFHGFTGNLRIAKELIKQGAYISFGKHLLMENSKASSVFKELPLEYVFLETDEWEGTITDIFSRAAKIKGISVVELRNQLYVNYKYLF